MSNSLKKGPLGGGLAAIIFGFLILFKFYDATQYKYIGMGCGAVLIILGILGITR
ncbi:hypothetical protein [Psychroserpens luteolus]|uniref:hypothetical protein n=1 Tax=Psychroserpens luteolus TaxID=2855840 RepID=UPI001E579FEB|nr:hypothetical protein [Psychroserpens luteolus]MCD2260023.1 hypothetical protein [Psychroserpens luteolus]